MTEAYALIGVLCTSEIMRYGLLGGLALAWVAGFTLGLSIGLLIGRRR